jgi:hypothetical protein
MEKSIDNLKHKPIMIVDDYDKIDAYNKTSTDARVLSIGHAQYSPAEISLKVFRLNKNKTWSRQSEELPLHRNLDLSILLLGALLTEQKSNRSKTNLREEIYADADISIIKQFYKSNEHFLKPRLMELKSLLTEFLAEH